jgi:hypothetical protein
MGALGIAQECVLKIGVKEGKSRGPSRMAESHGVFSTSYDPKLNE